MKIPSIKKLTFQWLVGLVIMALHSSYSMAQTIAATTPEATLNSGDTAWILISTALVLMMTIPGLALFYGGLVQKKNYYAIWVQCFSLAAIVSILWVIFGYSLAFSSGNAFIGSFQHFGLTNLAEINGTIPSMLFVMFQMTFAIITTCLIIGGPAERIRFSGVLAIGTCWFTLVYLPICYWVWGGGWLSQLGVIDFAGGLVVHLTAGTAALVLAILIGKREKFLVATLPHNVSLTAMGTALLWIGWFGFNAGSAISASTDAAQALLVTHLSTCAAIISWSIIEKIKYGKISLIGVATGAIAGLGSITPAAGSVSWLGALIIGFSAGALCYYAVTLLTHKLKIDDSLDVFAVHGVGGILGTLSVGLLAADTFGGNGYADGISMVEQIGIQLVGIISVFSYTAVVTYLIYKAVSYVLDIRLTQVEEEIGQDSIDHGA